MEIDDLDGLDLDQLEQEAMASEQKKALSKSATQATTAIGTANGSMPLTGNGLASGLAYDELSKEQLIEL